MSARLAIALEAFDRALSGSARPARKLDGRRITTESGSGQGVVTMTQKPILTEAGHAAAAAKVLEEMKRPTKPLHEMSADESIARRNEGWAGIIPPRRNAGLTISEYRR